MAAKFIAFEGIDGAGKSTLIRLLASHLESMHREVILTAEPTKNYLGKLIREVLNGTREGHEQTIASLFLADRIDHLTHSEYGILQYLAKGCDVLCDRYYLSSYAYHVPHVSLDWVIEANAICAAHKRPDITFFIDISVEESMRRLTASRATLDRFENEKRISQVRQNYFNAIDKVCAQENIVIIDGHRSVEEVYGDVIHHTSNLILS